MTPEEKEEFKTTVLSAVRETVGDVIEGVIAEYGERLHQIELLLCVREGPRAPGIRAVRAGEVIAGDCVASMRQRLFARLEAIAELDDDDKKEIARLCELVRAVLGDPDGEEEQG